MKVNLLGATGAVGKEVLKLLLEMVEVERVTIYVRKKVTIVHPKLKQIVSTLETQAIENIILEGNVLISCLGSTKKKTPNPKDYYHIDVTIPYTFARALSQQQHLDPLQIHVISAIGANANSKNNYLMMKGKLEELVVDLKIADTYFYRPSLIIGERGEKRWSENMAQKVMNVVQPLLKGSLERYQSLESKQIARAVVYNLIHSKKGIHILEVPDIKSVI